LQRNLSAINIPSGPKNVQFLSLRFVYVMTQQTGDPCIKRSVDYLE